MSNHQSLIWREPASTLMLLMTICKLRSISVELQDHSHHHYCPAVRSVDLESSQRISSLESGDSLSISLTQRWECQLWYPKTFVLTYVHYSQRCCSKILTLGTGSLLAKIDIKSAFWLLPVHPADRHLLGIKWNGEVYLDCCLPFGLRSAPRLFNILADLGLLEWILKQQGVLHCFHYLDDFLTIGPPESSACQQNLGIIKQVCEWLGIPLALEKWRVCPHP